MLDNHIGANLHLHGNVLASNEMQSTASASLQKAGDAKSISSVIAEYPQTDQPSNRKPRKKNKHTAPNPDPKTAVSASTSTPAETRETKRERNRVARATALRKEYPTMQNIPKSITPAQKKRLILHHTQNATNTLQPAHSANIQGPSDAGPTPTTQSRNSKKAATKEKQKNRATLLKQQYPGMKGIPSKIGQGARKKLIAQYKARSSALAPSVTKPTSSGTTVRNTSHSGELPTRFVPPTTTSGMNATHQSYSSLNTY